MTSTWSAKDGPWRGAGIAVVGMAGRFPQARSINELWRNLSEGRDCISRFSEDELRAEGVDDATRRHERFVPAGAVLESIDQFDAELFRIGPREAESMDPQQRLLLEVVHEALDDAGVDPRRDGRVGMYAGGRLSGYWLQLLHDPEFMSTMGWHQVAAGNDKDFLATQVSFRLDLRGPSVNVQAACSTSLLAVALAADALVADQCDVAVAGGASVAVPHRTGYVYQPGGIASPDGVCRPFDAGANGSVLGNGVAVVVLKTVERALRDRDRILAVLRSTAVNNDGQSKSSFAAPSVEGQTRVIAAALRHAAVDAADIGYVETHGTGTALGDPIEATALGRAFAGRSGDPVGIGSVKSNLGHLDPAAGITSFIKVVLSLSRQAIPPSIHYERPNPAVDLPELGLRVVTELEPWPAGGRPRRAGVSSFGIGGTNVHAILEEAPVEPPVDDRAGDAQLLVVSAASVAALDEASQQLADALDATGTPLADVAFTLHHRRALAVRRWVVAATAGEAAAALRGASSSTVVRGGQDGQVCLLLPGQGTQHTGMGRELYRKEPSFRAAFDEAAELCGRYLDTDLRELVVLDSYDEDDEARIRRTVVAQPLLFAVEHACAALWRHWGVEPAAVLGHSVGELVGASLCGVMSLEDAARVVAARGRLMEAAPEGAMLAVSVDADTALALEDDEVRVSAFNGPRQQTLSAPLSRVDDLEARLSTRGITWQRLRTSHAFHHPSMARAAADLELLLREVDLRPPDRPFFSTVTGSRMTAEQAVDPAFWASGVTRPVRFSAAAAELVAESGSVLLECGPGSTLTTLTRAQATDGTTAMCTSLPVPGSRDGDRVTTLRALGTLWQAGVPVDWSGVWRDHDARRVDLPAYPFQRRRYWRESVAGSPLPPAVAPTPPARTTAPVASAATDGVPPRQEPSSTPSSVTPPTGALPTAHVPVWRPAGVPPSGGEEPACWLVLAHPSGLGAVLPAALASGSADVVTVVPAPTFAQGAGPAFGIDPGSAEDARRLVEALDAVDPARRPVRLVNTWTTEPPIGPHSVDRALRGVLLGFRAPMVLLQALARAGRRVTGVDTVTTQLLVATGSEMPDPTFAPALGLVRVLPQEWPDCQARLVDLDRPTDPAHAHVLLAELVAELLAGRAEPVVAYRSGLRLVESFQPVELPPPDALVPRLRPGGTYLVTGGFGGIGGVLARALAVATRPHLVLVGRQGTGADGDAGDAARRLVGELGQLGAQVTPVAADVTRPDQVEGLVRELGARFGPVAGAIHAAGVPGGGLLATREPDAADAVFAPKTAGTVALLAALVPHRPDFVALCSSFAAVGGGTGQADYSGANATLDALAWYGRMIGLPVTSIAWPAWRDVGMAARMTLPPELAAVKAQSLATGIDPADGVRLFASLVVAGYPQVVLPPVAPAGAAAPAPPVAPAGAAAAVPPAPPAPAAEPARWDQPVPSAQSTPAQPQVAGADDDAELRGVLRDRLRGLWADALGAQPSEVDRDFFELGGQSLLGLQIVGRISEQFSVPVELNDLLQHPTLTELADLVYERVVQHVAALPDARVDELLAPRGE